MRTEPDGDVAPRRLDRLPSPLPAVRWAAPVVLVVVVQVVLFPMPPAVWFQGFLYGLLGALMAVGLALVFRLNRIVNFAQGDLGSAPTVLAYGLIALSGVNYFLGLATGLVATVVLTAGLEVLVIRRFVRAPRLVLTVATIGLSQALIVGSLLVPRLWGGASIGQAAIAFPWHVRLSLSPVVLTADDLVALVVAPLALGAVALWSKRSELGIAARATGDRRDRAAMLGIPVNRLQTVTWVVAGLLSFLGLFCKAAIVGLPLGPTFSLVALVTALGALALGGFTDLPRVAAAAVAVGTLEQGVSWDEPQRPTLVLAVLAAVVVGGLLVQGVGGDAFAWSGGEGWSLVGAVRSRAGGAARLPEVRATRTVGLVVAAATLATLPVWMGPGNLLEVSTLLVLAVVGCSVVVLTGWSGQVSLGQMSFAAVGGTVGAVALADWHWDLSLALLAGGAAASVAAVVVGLPTLRLDGIVVAVTTLAFALAASSYLLDRAEFSWIPSGQLPTPDLFGVPIASPSGVFLLCLGVGALVVAGMHGLHASRTGRAWRAVAANERAAAGHGIDAGRARLSGFAVSGFIAGLAGCLLVVVNQQYVETPFDVTQSLVVFTATVVGGLGSAGGALIGAALVEGSTLFLPPSWQLFPSAAGVLIVLFAFPGGVAGLCADGWDRLVAVLVRRRETGGGAVGRTGGGGGRSRLPLPAPAARPDEGLVTS
jgi:branched-chain amino acid transport system permease protein